MIKLFKNVALQPNGFFFRDSTEDVILIENPDETFLMGNDGTFKFIYYAQSYEQLLKQFKNEQAFFSYLANYPQDRVLTIYASKGEYAKLYLRFLVELYPKATDDDLVHLYSITLDKPRLVLNGKIFDIQPEARQQLILECTVTEAVARSTIDSYRKNLLGVMTDAVKSNLAFEWLYMDYLVNGLESEYLLQLIELTKVFLYPHFIMLHNGVCSMNNLFSTMLIPLTLRYDFNQIANSGKFYGNGSGTQVDAFIKKYGSYIKTALGG